MAVRHAYAVEELGRHIVPRCDGWLDPRVIRGRPYDLRENDVLFIEEPRTLRRWAKLVRRT